jgi:hypothetical protein
VLLVTSGRVKLYLGSVGMSGELCVLATTYGVRAVCTC